MHSRMTSGLRAAVDRLSLTGLPGIHVCIFDVNGVLIDSNLANAGAMARSFTDDPRLQQQIVSLYLSLTGIDRGSKIRIIHEQIVGNPLSDEDFARRWERFKTLGRLSMLQAPLTDGCKEVLTAIGNLGIARVALSNTPLAELRETLATHRLEPFLDEIRGGGDWPKSESLLRFLTESTSRREKILFFGDGKGDLSAARQAGVAFVAIDSGTGQFENEEGFAGPYKSLAHWAIEVTGTNRHRGSREG